MGLNIPDLDSKDFDTLVQEAIAKLPSLAPEWTDYNLSDPGITVIELLAWFADMDYYRLNRVRDEHLRAFLKIAGMECGENVPANVLVTFSSSHDGVQTISAGTELTGGNLPFVTQSTVRVLPEGTGIEFVRVDDLSGPQMVRPRDFHPFGRHLHDGANFTLEFSGKVSGELDLYIVASGHADEVIDDAQVVWHYYDKTKNWKPVEAVDGTNALINSGSITLKLPGDAGTSMLRCMLKKPQWYETPPLIGEILLNSVVVLQEKSNKIVLGESSGYVNQRFTLGGAFMSDTLEVKVGAKKWNRVTTLQEAQPDDHVYMLGASEIIFGDGAKGKIPQRGATIRCRYLSNEGSRGNLKNASVWSYDDEKISLHNGYSGWGGEDKKSIDEAFGAFQNSLNAVHRAVTLADYEVLALATPGTRLARAKAVADKKKNRVTVVIVPQSENSEPMPGALTRNRVEAYLESKRLLTTTVRIEEPVYTKVHVQAKVHTELADPVMLQALVTETLEAFLHPLSGGRDGSGWDFGKSLYLSDLYALVAEVEGVLAIKSLDIMINKVVDGTIKRQKVQKVEIENNALIASGKIGVSVITPDSWICGSRV